MWHVIYLSLINVFIGVSSSVIVRRRADWVRRQTEQGYDFKNSFPARLTDRLPFSKSSPVDIEQLCKTIDPEFEFCASDLQIQQLEPTTESSEELVSTEMESVGTEAELVTVESEEAATDQIDQSVGDSTLAAEMQEECIESAPEGPESMMEVIDLQATSAEDLEDVTDEVSDHLDRDDSEAFASGDEGTETEADASSDSPASVQKTQEEDLTPDDSMLLGEANTDIEEEASVDGDSEAADDSSEDAEAEAPEIEGDFLHRISVIEGTLQKLMDEDDATSTIGEPSRQLLDAATYWDSFRDSAKSILESGSAQSNDPNAMQSIEEVVDTVNQEVASCQDIAQKAADGNLGTNPNETTTQLRDHVLEAAKGSHLLRDQLAVSIANQSLTFSNCTPENLLDYSEGLSGFEEVVQAWTVKDEDSFAGLGIIDIDGFDMVNRDFGLRMSDRVLANCCQHINTSIRHNRGYDRLIRIGGQQFLIFFGYTAGKDVCFALERIRQSFAQTDFEIRGELTHIDVRGAAIDFQPDRNPLEHLRHLQAGLAKAKELGGNNVVCGSFDEEFVVVNGLPEYDLPIRSVEIADQTVVSG